VRPASRAGGLGRALTLAAIDEARRLGYAACDSTRCLDGCGARRCTRVSASARSSPYRFNPVEGSQFLELTLA
jgi:hypothetical protein